MQDANPSMGATVGRVAGRIKNATFNISLDGSRSNVRVYRLDKNDGENTLHGGFHNFAKVTYLL